jgi:magnesium transporter
VPRDGLEELVLDSGAGWAPLRQRPNRQARVQRERIEIRSLLNRKAFRILTERLSSMHPADIADYAEDMQPKELKLVLSLIENEDAVEVFAHIEDEDVQLALAKALGRERLAEILEAMPSDDVVDLLANFDPDELDQVLDSLDDEDAEDLKELLSFDDESAGGLMAIELIHFRPELTTTECIERIRENQEELESVNYLYLTNDENVLVGVVSLREIILAGPETRLGQIMETDVIRVHVEDDQEEVANLVARYDLLAVPVVDDHGVLKGIVTVDDVMDVLEEEATEDMFGMAGLSLDEAEEESAFNSAARRVPWLLTTLLGAFLSGFLLNWYSNVLHETVALAIFIPAIMGLGGNIAVQSSTLVIRGFATGDVEDREVPALLFKEVKVGLLLGILLGTASGAAGYLWVGNPLLGVVVAISMTAQFTVSATNGTFFPYLLRRLGVDPALSSGPFVTMVSDLTGLVIYFSLATYMLHHATLIKTFLG